MSIPKIQLSDNLQETIAYNQEGNCEAARANILLLDSWMSTIIHGHPIMADSSEEQLKMIQALDNMKRDYQSFIIE